MFSSQCFSLASLPHQVAVRRTFSASPNPNSRSPSRRITCNRTYSVVKRIRTRRSPRSKREGDLCPATSLFDRPARTMTNNIYGNEPAQTVQKSHTYSEKNRSTIFDEAPRQQPSNKPDRQRSDIFGANEPAHSASTRPVTERFKSNIFGNGDQEEQNKRQPGHRQGLRGRLPSSYTEDGYRSSIAISLYSPLRLKGSIRCCSFAICLRFRLCLALGSFCAFHLDPNASRSESALRFCLIHLCFLRREERKKETIFSECPNISH